MRNLLLFFAFAIGAQASANSTFIPNYYKNRRAPNLFSAIGWSDRHEVGLNYINDTSTNKFQDIKNSDSKSNSYTPYAFYRLDNGLNFEGSINKLTEDRTFVSGSSGTSKSDSMTYLGSAGYEFSNLPIALGATYFNLSDDLTDSTSGKKTTFGYTGIALGAGYRLPSDIYLGAGLFRTTATYSSTPDATVYNYYVGGGTVLGDKKNPDAAIEMVLNFSNADSTQMQELTINGLYNIGAFQPYGMVKAGRSQGNSAGHDFGVKAGLDYEFMNFFVGPEVEYESDIKDSDTRADTTTLTPGLQVGYRITMLEAYVSYGMNNEKREYGNPNYLPTKEDHNLIGAGFSYKF